MDGISQTQAAELVQRLALYAYSLFHCFPHSGYEPVLKISGKGPEDLAMDVMVRLLDPADTSVQWDPGRGEPLPYLKKVLWNDFVDLTRSKLYRHADATLSFDEFVSAIETPEAQAARREQQERLLDRFAGEPELQRMLALQLPPEGYQALTNRQLAARLGIGVDEVENRKKRLMNRLLRFAHEAQLQERKSHGQRS